jgi:hypothetical protein
MGSRLRGNDVSGDAACSTRPRYGQHPRLKHQRDNAEILTAFIKKKMNW